MAAQLDAIRVIHAPLTKPYDTRPTTTTPPGNTVGVHRVYKNRALRTPMETNVFQTPKRSARRPEATRPKNEPVWRKATA
jgi:hypothetical protein